MNDNRSLTIYLEDLADRALRFHLHLDAVEQQFFRSSPGYMENNFPRDKPIYLDSLRSCVGTVLQTVGQLAIALSKKVEANQNTQFMMIARHAFVCINQLHEQGLIHLPRPSEPVELRRFCRIIARHVLSRNTNDLLVYITEATPDQAYAADPVSQLKRQDFSKLVDMANTALGGTPLMLPNITGIDSIHITVSRIEARNPLHWPILLHEAGHKLLTNKVVNHDLSSASDPSQLNSLFTEFKGWLPNGLFDRFEKLDISIESWLTETWCDLFAAFVMGPAFFFSQFSAFLAEPPTDAKLENDYPPHGFRLRLIEIMLRHSYDTLAKAGIVSNHMRECLATVDYIDRSKGIELGSRADLRCIFDAFRLFFHEHFFSGSGSEPENIRKNYANMVRHVDNIEVKELARMQKHLSDGLPVASKRKDKKSLIEIPSSIQEVLLAAWLDRLNRVRPSTLKDLKSGDDFEKVKKEKILPRINRFDESVLRSLQLAEWLHVIAPKVPKPLPERKSISKPKNPIIHKAPASLLSDFEILDLLKTGDLHIIPLVDIEAQIGSASLDIRLGTSFQIYLPASRRTTEDSTNEFKEYFDTRQIDLDFLEHVVLMPGQFMLGHSFEYLKLPNCLAADLDGRSSYARQGLEVHMTAGIIDAGFEGTVTFELFNSGPNPIPLFPGLRIAQLRFFRVNEPLRPYSQRSTAKYRNRLQHNTSLHMNDTDFKRINNAIEEHRRRQKALKN